LSPSNPHPPSGHTACVMVAPNGARLTQQDHPAIPITPSELVACVAESVDNGAEAVHLHVRDAKQLHVLDAQRYRAAIDAIHRSQGKSFPVQITTEAVGRFTQAEQVDVVKQVKPEFVSVALVEMAGEEVLLEEASRFYHWCNAEHVSVQHILYNASEFRRFAQLKKRGVIPPESTSVLFVLGKYVANQLSDPAMLDEFLQVREEVDSQHQLRWMVCAFAAAQGGHIRVGFENNRINEDGQVASSNAERVKAVCNRINALPEVSCGSDQLRYVLGQPA